MEIYGAVMKKNETIFLFFIFMLSEKSVIFVS